MSREIKFRGRRVDNGEWFYGDYYRAYKRLDTHYIASEDSFGEEVDRGTVGQFTGLRDKNGVEIYEGDIILIQVKNSKLKIIREHKAKVIYDNELTQYLLEHDGRGTMLHTTYEDLHYWSKQGGIIGNIHDNPELLVSE